MMEEPVLGLVAVAAVLFAIGGLSRFFKFQLFGQEPTAWWRGSMGFLNFAIALMLWRILIEVKHLQR